MSEPNWEQIRNPKIRDQVRYIWGEFRREGVAAELGESYDANEAGGIDLGVALSADGLSFMYAEGQILVQENYLEKVQEILGQPRVGLQDIRDAPKGSAPVEPLTGGVVVLQLPRGEDGKKVPALDAVAYGNGGAGISVFVGDTGLLWYPGDQVKDYGPPAHPHRVVTNEGTVHPWLKGVRGTLDKLEDLTGGNVIQPYEGHGTFVAGVARCMAPAADIFVANIFKVAGSTLESHLVRHLDAELAHGYDIFHLSIEAPTRKDLPLIAFERWLRRVHEYKGVACVVSAGNSGYSLPTWPAAFPQVVSVGALAADWRSRALFSNYGPWVDVYAPGRDLVNAFAAGTYTCNTYPYTGQVRNFYGMAKWSGTSFSTPVVTGLIAARMSRTGENGREAAAALLAEARANAIPGVGPVLLPY